MGTKVVTYNYSDAWGNHTTTYSNSGDSTGAFYNPFRYRGYYYDTELGMYYLQSRYYDAKICRFINADGYVSTGQGIHSSNMYVYCGNNAVNRVDPGGEFYLDNNNYLDDFLLEGGGGGNGVCSPGKAYYSCNYTLPKDGTKLSSSNALDLATNYLGNGYSEASSGRFVSADGYRQVRLYNDDILGLHAGGPHINFDRLYPTYKSVHVYIFDD